MTSFESRHHPIRFWIGAWSICTLCSIVFTVPSAALDIPDLSTLVVDTTDAYIIADSLFVEVLENEHAILMNHRVIKVNSSLGQKYGNIGLSENKLIHIRKIFGRQIDSAGIVIDSMAQKNDLRKDCGFGPEFTLYSDECYYTGAFKATRVPYTVEWYSTVEFETVGIWTGWLPDQNLCTKSGFCDFKVSATSNFKLAASGTDCKIVADSVGTNTYRWSIADLPPLDAEVSEYWPSRRKARVYIVPESFKFAGTDFDGRSWNSLSKGSYEIMKGAFKASESQKSLVEDIFKLQPTDLLDSLHRALANRFRYAAIYFGMGSWIPHKTGETFRLGYGDCKDLAALYSSMFEMAGVSAHLALISTRNTEFINPDLPTIGLFNHMIAYYVNGGDTTWMDPTCFECALGDLPYSVEGVSALAIDSLNGCLLKTPVSDYSQNTISRFFDITITGDFSANLQFRSLLSGNSAHSIQTKIAGADAAILSDRLMRYLGFRTDEAIDHDAIKITNRDLSRLGISFDRSQQRLLKPAGNACLLDLSEFRLMGDVELLDLSQRKHTLELGTPCIVVDTFRIVLPSGREWRALPPSDNYSSRFGDLLLSSSAVADTVIITRSLSRKLNKIEPSDFDEYQSYRKEILLRLRPSVTVSKTGD